MRHGGAPGSSAGSCSLPQSAQVRSREPQRSPSAQEGHLPPRLKSCLKLLVGSIILSHCINHTYICFCQVLDHLLPFFSLEGILFIDSFSVH